MFGENDVRMMQNALASTWLGRLSTSSNSHVSCVIAYGGQIVGQGFHVKTGEPHAEIHALRQAGEMARGATAYATLEPYSHYGRMPPCAEALIRSGVARAVTAVTDPNPLVAGKDLAMLEAVDTHTESGLLEIEAREPNRGFFPRIERDRPFVRIKCATSLNSKTALSDGLSKWIIGEAAREDVQTLRAESYAVVTEAGTVLADNPQLNVRAFPTVRQPVRIITDSRLQTPPDCHIIRDNGSPALIATLSQDADRPNTFSRFPHVEIIRPSEKDGRIGLADLPKILAAKGCDEVMVEAGAVLPSAFLAEDLADELVPYQAPKILGCPGRSMFTLPENPAALTESPCWETRSAKTLGGDIKWILRKTMG